MTPATPGRADRRPADAGQPTPDQPADAARRSTRTTSPGRSPPRSSRPARTRRRAAAAGSAGRSPSRSSRSSSAPRRPSPRSSPAARRPRPSSATCPSDTIVYGEVRLDLPGDQTPGRRRVPLEVPGLRRPGRRSTPSSTRSSTTWSATRLERRADLHRRHQAVVRRRARLQRRPAAAGRVAVQGRRHRSMGTFRALALLSIKDQARRAGVVRRRVQEGRRDTDDRDLQRRRPSPSSRRPPGVTTAYAHRRRQGRRRSATSRRSRPPSTPTATAASRTSPARRPRSIRSSGDHVGFVYVALRPLLDWSTDAQQVDGSSAAGGLATEVISDAMLKLVPEWAAYWLSFENDAIVMEATAPRAGDGDRSDREPHARRSPSTSRRRRSSRRSPTTAARPSSEMLDLYGSEPAFKPMLDQLDQGLGLVGGADAAFGWVGDTRDRRQRRGRHAGRRPDRRRRPTRKRQTGCSPRSRRSSRSVAPSRASPSGRGLQRHDDHDRRPRRRRQAGRRGRSRCPRHPAAGRPPRDRRTR